MKAPAVLVTVLISTVMGWSQTLSRAEYFFDADPGPGNANSLALIAGATISQTFNIPTTGLAPGFHTLNTRVRNNAGVWSIFASRTFFIVPPSVTITPATQILEGEYFIDADPGVSNGVPISLTPGPSTNFVINVPTTSLSHGFHTVNVRVLDNRSRWSLFTQRTFYLVPPTGQVVSTLVSKAEYFIDKDPGVGKALPLAITSGNPQDNTFSIDLTSLPSGFHQLGIRCQDNLGRWSHFTNRTFYILSTHVTTTSVINKLEYFIDVNPDITASVDGKGIPIVPSANIDTDIPIDLSALPTGTHTLYVRAQDDKGFWSTIEHGDFTILNCTTPIPPVANAMNRCDPGAVTLTASGATSTQVYRWYENGTTNSVLSTGGAFTTPPLQATRTYHVSIFDPATGCESARTSVSAGILFSSIPTVTPSGSISFCQGGSVILSAPEGFSGYTWSNGETTRQIIVHVSGQYGVRVSDGNCESAVSEVVNVAVVTGPERPTVSVAGNTVICEVGSVILTAPTGFGYQWSTGATTQSITVSQTGVYFVRVSSGGICLSEASEPVAVTVQTAPCANGNGGNQPPLIDAQPIAVPIEGQVSIDLTTLVTDADGNVDYGSLRLLNSSTARGASATIDGSYNLQVDYSNLPFTGTDRITLEVCDLAGACVQQVLDIEVAGAVVVYNGITPNGDGKNDFLLLKYIDVIESAKQNRVTIFNRWGDVVFNVTDYDNIDRAFRGVHQNGDNLPSGTYFYQIEFTSDLKSLKGFLTLKR